MTIKRIVLDIATRNVAKVRQFYIDLFDMDIAMDQGWISTLDTGKPSPTQISIASEGGSGTEVPDISIEVENVDDIYQRAIAHGFQITYDLTDEPWGVRRFYLLDPAGKTLNILSHTP